MRLRFRRRTIQRKRSMPYIIKESMSTELDIYKTEDNYGRRTVAKISLNSLGKFGQRNNMNQTKYMTDLCEFYKTPLDDRLNNTNITLISLNDSIIQMLYDTGEILICIRATSWLNNFFNSH